MQVRNRALWEYDISSAQEPIYQGHPWCFLVSVADIENETSLEVKQKSGKAMVRTRLCFFSALRAAR